ncbi:uncharacterized protein [Triticum aestivum]|uniref:uncharacterized protein isoform X1 n=1 Tax=Triticum aestivum TaxID=4565 RepID=UPI001D028BEF|nr:uncharacterized protein LOC123173430 isoform X1 [Triticum aestivum]XP_044446666.1 uncharacterized protein LOC123176615 isoform X1 [Triticum aestivum]
MACELPISQRAAPPKPSPAPIAVLPKGLPPSYAAQIPARSGWTGHGRYRHQPPPPGALCGVRGAAPPSHDPLSSLPWCKWCGEARAPSTEILPVRWAVSLDFAVAAAHSATALRALTADCTQSASAVSCAGSASHYLQDHGPVAPTLSTTAMLTLPGMCTGLRLCDTSRSSKRVRTCTSVFTSIPSIKKYKSV